MKDKLKTSRALHFDQLPILLALAALCVVMSVLSGDFLSQYNVVNILQQTTINATLAIGMTFVIITGGIDLSVGSILAFSGIFLGMMLKGGVPAPLAIALCLLIGCACGLLNGALVAYAKLPPFIVTLGMLSIARGLALIIAGGKNNSTFSAGFRALGTYRIGGVLPIQVVFVIILYLAAHYVLRFRKAGRYLYAIGGNEEATRLSGVNVRRYVAAAYVACGLAAAFASVILTAKLNSAQPSAGDGFELNAVAAAVIGGASLSGGCGSASGTLLGALIMSVLANGLTLLNVSSYAQQVVIGAVIILAVLLDVVRKRKS